MVAHIVNGENPRVTEKIDAGKEGLRRSLCAGSSTGSATNTLPPHVSLVTCAAAPSLFYADWVERIPDDCPRLARPARRAARAAPGDAAASRMRGYFPPLLPPRRARPGLRESLSMADNHELTVTEYIECPARQGVGHDDQPAWKSGGARSRGASRSTTRTAARADAAR